MIASAEAEVGPPNEEKLTEAWQLFQTKGLETEILAGFEGTNVGYTGNAFDDILNISEVHPLREDTIRELLDRDKADMFVVLSLMSLKLIKETTFNGKKYYVRRYMSHI